MLLDPGYVRTLRPMKYPEFFKMYKQGVANTWTTEEIDFTLDVAQLTGGVLTEAQTHLVKRLVAFFATGDSIVSDNLVLTLYKHINSPEARMYLSRQLFEEALHVETYLLLLDNYIPGMWEREQMFDAINNIPSIKQKADFCDKYMKLSEEADLHDKMERKKFLLTQMCFSACVEGMFFYAAFAYVYYLRSLGLLNGLADATNYVFKDETCHMNFGYAVIDKVRQEEPYLFDDDLYVKVRAMLDEAVECEMGFAKDILFNDELPGLSLKDMRKYLEFVKCQRLVDLGYETDWLGSDGKPVEQPFAFMELQGMQGLTDFFSRRVTDYRKGITGTVRFDAVF